MLLQSIFKKIMAKNDSLNKTSNKFNRNDNVNQLIK